MSYRAANSNGKGSRWRPVQFPTTMPAHIVNPVAVQLLTTRAGNDNMGYKK